MGLSFYATRAQPPRAPPQIVDNLTVLKGSGAAITDIFHF